MQRRVQGRLGGANNRFRGGFCPQRVWSVEGALGILLVGPCRQTMGVQCGAEQYAGGGRDAHRGLAGGAGKCGIPLL